MAAAEVEAAAKGGPEEAEVKKAALEEEARPISVCGRLSRSSSASAPRRRWMPRRVGGRRRVRLGQGGGRGGQALPAPEDVGAEARPLANPWQPPRSRLPRRTGPRRRR